MTELWRLLIRGAVRGWRVAGFVLYFSYEFLQSNVVVLREILAPRGRAEPAIVEVLLSSRNSREAVSLANLLTLTPGTLAIELADDPPTLYVHAMFAHDPAAFVADVHDLERRMLAALRPVGAAPGPADPAGTARR